MQIVSLDFKMSSAEIFPSLKSFNFIQHLVCVNFDSESDLENAPVITVDEIYGQYWYHCLSSNYQVHILLRNY